MVIILIVFVLIFLLLNLLFYVLIKAVFKIPAFKPSSGISGKVKMGIFFGTILLSGIVTYFYLYTSSAKNYKEAEILKEGNNHVVIIKGRRALLTHDLISVVIGTNTYLEKNIFTIPHDSGIIKISEIDNFNQGDFGKIEIINDSLKIDAYVRTSKTTSKPSSWNGVYILKRKD